LPGLTPGNALCQLFLTVTPFLIYPSRRHLGPLQALHRYGAHALIHLRTTKDRGQKNVGTPFPLPRRGPRRVTSCWWCNSLAGLAGSPSARSCGVLLVVATKPFMRFFH
jgi:hypothetical protein